METATDHETTGKRPRSGEGAFVRVAAMLGDAALRIHSPIDLHEHLLTGLPRAAAVHFVCSVEPTDLTGILRALNISARTWRRMRAGEAGATKRLKVDQSARLWTLASVLAHAENVLGSRAAAAQWLHRPAVALDSYRPVDLLATRQGADLVRGLLEQMEHGVYV